MEKSKMGRPTTNPRNKRLSLRLSEKELEMLNTCAEKTGKNKIDIIIEGIENIYKKYK